MNESRSQREVKLLRRFSERYRVKAQVIEKNGQLTEVDFTLGNRSFTLFVEDEYDDLNSASNLMNIFLCLRELAIYKDSSDFLQWSKMYGLGIEYLDYYKGLETVVQHVETLSGPIDYFVSDLDYELRTDVIELLLES